MASRGLWRLMSARTRRFLTVSWSALFVLSLGLQYFAFAAAPSALAVHDDGLFELDGNATNQAAAGDDWDQVYGGTSSAFQTKFITDAIDSSASEHLFTGGGSKDGSPISSWKWTTGAGVQDKNDIENAYAAAYTQASNGHSIVYFGQDRYAQSGDAFDGFWFFKGSVGEGANGAFTGAHQVGDILVQANFTNGGAIQDFDISKWNGSGLTSVATGVECTAALTNDDACGKVNGTAIGEIDSPWPYTPKAGTANKIPAGGFFEAGLDLTNLGLDTGCFSTFMAETRSSQSLTSTLSDYAFGSFSFCVGVDIETQVKQGGSSTGDNGHITIGQSVTDTATLSGTKGDATGSVQFFSCFDASSVPDCSTGGTDRGTKTLSNSAATSDPFTPAAVGNYCFRVEYTPAAGSHYLAGTHTNTSSECFVVDKKQPAIATSANQSVSVGAAIADSATLSGGTSDVSGNIVFRAYGPGDADCSNAPAFTSSAVSVSGNGSYGPVSFTPDTAGTYRWIASYGGDAKNAAVAGACNDDGETDTVTKVTPSIDTQASGSVTVGGDITDTATVSGGHSPTGTVTFKLYGPNDTTCATVIFTSANRPLSGGKATSTAFTTVDAGTYRWIATYNGDANNTSVGGSCNDAKESVVVTKANPSITTSLSGGGKTGASITVSLGTAVHDTSALQNASANAGGTVHYRVFTDSLCNNLFADAGTATVVNGVPGDSIAQTFTQAGTYYWQADYSGDANNAAASSACNLETVTVSRNIPAISTTASGTVAVGSNISDTAHLSGGFNPTGTITFHAYGPDDATCSTSVFLSVATVTGNGDYGSGNFAATTAGTYRWIASYGGDNNNAAVAGGCNDANESVVVTRKDPTVTTSASASVTVGGKIHDSASLAGGFNPTGSITFHLYGPNDATCATSIFTDTVTVNGNGSYPSADFTTAVAGTSRWIANYGGDANNNATANGCNDSNESVIVTKADPAVTTNASASVTVGGSIWDIAHLTGGFNPTGTITFDLYGPNDATCATSIAHSTASVNGNGDYSSALFSTVKAGTYRWIANYGGDANNGVTSNGCNAANENVIVTPAAPSIATTATVGGQVGDQVHDVATVSGGFNATGTVTFKLYGPADPTCGQAAVFTDTAALGQDGQATSGTFTVTLQGTYHWVASYSGDANNTPVAGACGDDGETTTIKQFSPDITTALHSGNLSGARITVLFGSSVTDQATLTGASATAGGTVTYTVFTDDQCTNVFADAGTKTVTNGASAASDPVSFPDAGTYYWQAGYSGDNANAPATSACTDEVLTVTTPNLHAEKLVSVNGGPFVHSNSAKPGDKLTYKITITNSGDADATNVPVSDDISAILAHAGYDNDASNGGVLNGSTLEWTIASIAKNGGSVALTFSVTLDATFPSGTTDLPNTAVVTGPGSNCEAGSDDAACSTDTTVEATPDLNAEKLVSVNDGPFVHSSSAKPGDTLTFHLTITNTGDGDAADVPVSDDITALLAHATYDNDASDGGILSGSTLSWTIPSIAGKGGSVTLSFSVTLSSEFPDGATQLPNTVVVTGPGSNCEAGSEDAACSTITTVEIPTLGLEKSNNAPIETIDLGNGQTAELPTAKEGATVTYTLKYTTNGVPQTNGVLLDVMPAGLSYVNGSATNSDEFTFVSATKHADGTTTLEWDAANVTKGGTLTYEATVDAGAAEVAQPLENLATIQTDQEGPVNATSDVFVQAPPQELTPPPTDSSIQPTAPSNPGTALMLILIGFAGLSLAIGFITPVPQRVRRRDRLG